MRSTIIGTSLTCLVFFASSCHPSTGHSDTQSLIGTYQGKLGKSAASVVINYINGDIVSGYDVIKGVRRNLNGRLKDQGKTVDFDLTDPGENATDGHYVVTLDTLQQTLTGTWKPMHPDKASEQPLSMKKKKQYKPEDDAIGMYEWMGMGEGARGGTLSFYDDGLCTFSYYKNRNDSTDQLNTIKGTYIRTKKSVTIDWETNDVFSASHMFLRMVDTALTPEYPQDTARVLTGNGWVFHINDAG